MTPKPKNIFMISLLKYLFLFITILLNYCISDTSISIIGHIIYNWDEFPVINLKDFYIPLVTGKVWGMDSEVRYFRDIKVFFY